jgi:serine/threonine protein kinase/Tfp pilus assembly protein PilF
MADATSVPPTIDESARKRFEAAWVRGEPLPLDAVLPPPDDPRFLATLEELVHIELELGWKAVRDTAASPPPRLEEYVNRYPVLREPGVLARLLRQEFRVRVRYADRPSTAEYQQRFPHLSVADDLETVTAEARPSTAAALPAVTGYQVLGFLGSGGMGVVYEARDAKLGRVVALKTAHADLAGVHSSVRERFLAEARIAAVLEHPGVVPVHDLLTGTAGEPCYTMKLVRGHTLKDAIERYHASSGDRAVEQQRLLSAYLTVVRTMAFVHSKGIIHRDLKPANVVLGDYGETVILDWGLAKVLGTSDGEAGSSPAGPSPDLTARGDVLGTPSFMAPEQAAGRTDEVNERSDVYALGAMLFQILTGRAPYTGGSAAEVLAKIRATDPPRPRAVVPAVPRALEAVCVKSLARRPADRYPGAAALAADVERFLAGEPVSAYPEGVAERAARWGRRHRTLVAVGGVASLITLLGGATGLYLLDRSDRDRREEAHRLEVRFEADAERERFQHQQALALQRQQQAFEDGRREERDRERRENDRRAALANAAAEAEGLGLGELRAGRFTAAERHLARGLDRVRGEPGLADAAARVAGRLERARRIAEFYRLKDRADRLAYETAPGGSPTDAEVVRSCEAALARLHVLDGPPDWWARLPGDDLLPAERARLEEDATVVLALLALWHIKKGFNPILEDPLAVFNPRAKAAARAEFELARGLTTRLRRYADARLGGAASPTTDLLELFCAILLEAKGLRQLRLVPRTAADAFFIGMAHVLIDVSAAGLGEWASRLLSWVGELKRYSGLDFATPRATAERLFRDAIAKDPGHYWAHSGLGYCHFVSKNWPAAEQAFGACVALRPDYVPAYLLRSETLLLRTVSLHQDDDWLIRRHAWPTAALSLAPLVGAPAATGGLADLARTRNDLMRRCQDGLEVAPPVIRYEPYVRWLLFRCQVWFGQPGSLDTSRSALEMIVLTREGGAGERPLDSSIAGWAVRDYRNWAKNSPGVIDYRGVLAVALLAGGDVPAAAREAEAVLKGAPDHPTARGVRGVLHLRAGRAAEALADFDRSLAVRPGGEMALTGRALALERLGRGPAALDAYAALLPPGEAAGSAGPLHLVASLGRARVYAKLGDEEKARAELQLARETDPVAADALADALYPAPKV